LKDLAIKFYCEAMPASMCGAMVMKDCEYVSIWI